METEDLIEKIRSGEIKLYEIEKFINNDVNKASEIRRKFLEQELNIKLDHLGKYSIDLNQTFNKNIENAIGCVQIPVGIAGPLKINGEYAKGLFYVPLATTEGALVASVNRGCSVITSSGGAFTKILYDKMTRAPLFKVKNISEAIRLTQWVKENFDEIKRKFEEGSRHLKLINIQPWIIGRNVWLRFEAQTGDAMGMNMVTIATERACNYITENFKEAKLVALSGNLCTDKKPGAINWLLGRGKTVLAEVTVPREIVKEKLKTTPEEAQEVAFKKNILASAFAHSYGLNAHIANIIAAVFLATGQDAAQITESSMGISYAEVNEEGNLYVSVYLPSLEIGTVGGGTGLPTQKESLRILGCEGGGKESGENAKKFAEIIAATVLAGEISLLAALAAGHLAKAHIRLGKGK
jgi:3-hydroxy-3-methylglutaryl-coenzyme A reductase (EC 1.1.1.34)